jgi:hypothetical protein
MANDKEKRKFTGAPAVRASVPLWIGLYGVSGGGKTFSALRLAQGILSVVGGKIGVGDTENRRALHYADRFDFVHYDFKPDFDPLSYLALIEQMAADGVTVAIIDSGSHEHEGQGGVLEMHEAECERLVKQWKSTRDKVQMSAWAKPKQERRKMIQGALRSPMHIIWCFRAKEKLEVRPGKAPVQKGFMPLAAEELVYEMALTALLLPGAQGVPTWQSEEIGERAMIKLPHWARAMVKNGPLSEEIGAALARWASGNEQPPIVYPDQDARAELLRLYDLLDETRRARLGKAIPSRAAIGTMPIDRVRKGIPVLAQAVQEQEIEWQRQQPADEPPPMPPELDGWVHGDAPEDER